MNNKNKTKNYFIISLNYDNYSLREFIEDREKDDGFYLYGQKNKRYKQIEKDDIVYFYYTNLKSKRFNRGIIAEATITKIDSYDDTKKTECLLYFKVNKTFVDNSLSYNNLSKEIDFKAPQSYEKITGDKLKKIQDLIEKAKPTDLRIYFNIYSAGRDEYNKIIEKDQRVTNEQAKLISNLKQETKKVPSCVIPVTSNELKKYALDNCNYICQLKDIVHCPDSFLSKRTGKQYLEVHHIIPMCNWKKYDEKGIRIDHKDNLICLCSTCHNRLHYGTSDDKKMLLQKIYDSRKNTELFKKAGITSNELIEMYNASDTDDALLD